MKKIFLCLISICFVLTGCSFGKKSEKTVINEFQDKVNKSDSYYLSGSMELVNNEDVYTYDISVSYKKDDFYKIELVNVINNHRQIILRNEEGVYIVTPSLNKSFKFQSDWPYNNSQVYLLSSLLDDIMNDEERKFETTDSGYVFTSMVNYPNNEKLVSQKVYFDKDYLPKRVEVIDSDGNIQIKMDFDKIDLKTEFNDTYFDLNSVLDTESIDEGNSSNNGNNSNTNNNSEVNNNSSNGSNNDRTSNEDNDMNNNVNNNTNNNTNNNSETQEPNNSSNNQSSDDEKTKETATIDDIIYPMYLPVNTYLTGQERVSTEDGERLILTFTGDSSFTLVEETVSYSSRPEIIPTYGDVELIGSSLAVINDNSANWFDNGIEYYIVSDVMSTNELLDVVRSISVLPVSK